MQHVWNPPPVSLFQTRAVGTGMESHREQKRGDDEAGTGTENGS